MKKIIYTIITLFLIMIISGSIGGIIFIKDYQVPEIKTQIINDEKYIQTDDLKFVNIDIGYDDVKILPTNKSQIYLKYKGEIKSTSDEFNTSLNIERNSDELNIKKISYNREKKIKVFDFDNMHSSKLTLEIFIPESKILSLNSEDSLVEIQNLDFNKLKIKTHSREILLDNINANILDLDTFSGKIKANNIDVKKIKIDSNSGSFIGNFIDNNSNDEFDLKGYSPDVEINNLNSKNFNVDLSSGDLKIKNSILNKADLESYSGNIESSKLKFNDIKIKTSSGDIQMNIAELGDLNIKTYSGEVELDLLENSSFNLIYDTYSGNIENSFPIVLKSNSKYKVEGFVGNKKDAKDIYIKLDSGNLKIN